VPASWIPNDQHHRIVFLTNAFIVFLRADHRRTLGPATSPALRIPESDILLGSFSPPSCSVLGGSRYRGMSENPGDMGDSPMVKPGKGAPGVLVTSPSTPSPSMVGNNKVPRRIILFRGCDTGGVRSGGWVELLIVRVRVIPDASASARYSVCADSSWA